jgi:hypothetical protein
MEEAVPPEIIVERSNTVRPISGPPELGLLDVFMVVAWENGSRFEKPKIVTPDHRPAWVIPGHAGASLP